MDLDLQGQCFSFDHQIERDYLNVYSELERQLGEPQAMAHLAKSIFTVAIGGNDIILRALPPSVTVDLLAVELQLLPPQQFIDLLAKNLERQLQVCMYTNKLNLHTPDRPPHRRRCFSDP
jgi:hypothetical protein